MQSNFAVLTATYVQLPVLENLDNSQWSCSNKADVNYENLVVYKKIQVLDRHYQYRLQLQCVMSPLFVAAATTSTILNTARATVSASCAAGGCIVVCFCRIMIRVAHYFPNQAILFRGCDWDQFFRFWPKAEIDRTEQSNWFTVYVDQYFRSYVECTAKLSFWEPARLTSCTTPRRTNWTGQTGQSQSKRRDRPTEHFFNFGRNT
jgi:hypothetical protein